MILKKNNFDFLRHYLAFCVVVHHFLVLNGIEESFVLFKIFNADFAVKSFFFISGILIWKSAVRTKYAKYFFLKRILRIYPALLVILLFCSIVFVFLGEPIVSIVKYFFWNSIFLNFIYPCVGDVFSENTICAVNGSLWTLKLEVSFYVIVGVLVYCFKKYSFLLVVFFTILSFFLDFLFYFGVLENIPYIDKLANQIFFKFYYFGFGVFYVKYHAFFTLRVVLMILLLSVFSYFLEFPDFLSLLLFIYSFIIFMSFYFPYINMERIGDLSYGMYIFHFPLIQFFVYFDFFTGSFFLDFLFIFLVLLFFSKVSWVFFESKLIYRDKGIHKS